MRKVSANLFRLLLECAVLLLVTSFRQSEHTETVAQSIGYQPQFNFGFNPYNSPVFGYGLGLPFGSYNLSPTRNPWLLNSMPQVNFFDKTGLMSKIHAKAFLKKLATSQILTPGYHHAIKDKLNLMKHPEMAYTPYGAGYGYGKHYGAALVPNNPYKSTYSDYYDNQATSFGKPSVVSPLKHEASIPIGGRPHDYVESSTITSVKPYGNLIKPILKVGAMLTTAAILGKKIFEVPIRLNPTGMILHEMKP